MSMSIQSNKPQIELSKKIIKIKRPIVGKSFKLIDFHIYDDNSDLEQDSDEDNTQYRQLKDTSKFTIQMFGISENGETCAIYIPDFQPFFYVKGADNWNQENADQLLTELREKLAKFQKSSILTAELVEYHKLYGFSGGKKHKFVKLVFKNQATMNKVKGFWYEYKKRFKNSTTSERIMTPLISQTVELEL